MRKKLFGILLGMSFSILLCGSASASWLSGFFGTQEETEEETSSEPTEEETEEATQEAVSPGGAWMQGIFDPPEEPATEEPVSPEETEPVTEEPASPAETEPVTEGISYAETEEPTPEEAQTEEPPVAIEFEAETEPDFYNMTFNELIDAYRMLLGKYNGLVSSGQVAAVPAPGNPEPSSEPEPFTGEEPTSEEEPFSEAESESEPENRPVQPASSEIDTDAVAFNLHKGDFFMLYDLLKNELPDDIKAELSELSMMQIDSNFRYDNNVLTFASRGHVFLNLFLDNFETGLRCTNGNYNFASYEYEILIFENREMLRLKPQRDTYTIVLDRETLQKISEESADPEIRLYLANGTYSNQAVSVNEAKIVMKILHVIDYISEMCGIVNP